MDLDVGLPETLHRPARGHRRVAPWPSACAVRAAVPRAAGNRAGYLQDLADRLNLEGVKILVEEIPQDFSRRSCSALAKNALASFRISLAQRSSLISRSISFVRWASLVATPSPTQLSISSRLTHSLSVCGTQPIFGASIRWQPTAMGSPRGTLHHPFQRAHAPRSNLVSLPHGSILSECEPLKRRALQTLRQAWQRPN